MTDKLKLKTLRDCGPFAVGDFVFCNDIKKETGGVIYQIVQDTEPVKVHATVKKTTRKEYVFKTNSFKNVPYNAYGFWDENGKKIAICATRGFIRIAPRFTFFASPTGTRPKGKNETILIEYPDVSRLLKPVDIVSLGVKYVEFGDIIKEIVARKSSSDQETTEGAHGEPTETLETAQGIV